MTAQALIKCDVSGCPELPERSLWNISYFSSLRGQFLFIFKSLLAGSCVDPTDAPKVI